MINSSATGVTLKQVRAFYAVAKLGSFTRAAERLALSQPALTMTIRQLEATVGVGLFNRTSRRVMLTAVGKEFLPTAERLLGDFDLAFEDLRAVAELRRGQLGIAATFSVAAHILPDAVNEFATQYPAIRIHLRDGDSSTVRRWVRHHELDFGFACGNIDDPELEYYPVFRDRMGAVARKDHSLMLQNRPVTWADLTEHDFLGLGKDTGLWPIFNEFVYSRSSFKSPRFEISGTVTLQVALESGLGVTALPALASPEHAGGSLRYRPLENPTVMRDVYLVTRKGRTLSSAARTMRALVLERISDLAKKNPLMECTICG